jgi:hypothetical protein
MGPAPRSSPAHVPEGEANTGDSVGRRLGTLETAAAEQKAALKDQADLRAAMDKAWPTSV